MKRGKDDEKIIGPMFPRLHVNDTKKGGPRAPPRNKMALYEQLSIPTQRFNHGVLSLNPSNCSSLVPPGSSSQGSGLQRNLPFTHPRSPSTPTHLDEKFHARQPAEASLNTPLPHHEQSKKVGDEDDFTVPVFVQAGMGQCHRKSQNDIDVANISPFNPTSTGQSTKFQNACDKNPKHLSSLGLSLRQEGRHQSQENPKICIPSRDHPAKSSVNLSTREKIDGLVKQLSASPNQECKEITGYKFNRLNDSDAPSGLPPNSCRRDDDVESKRDIQKGVVNPPRRDTRSWEDSSHPSGFDNDSRYHVDKTLQLGSGDQSDDVSETSMVGSISGMEISPDDVVGIIGHKHFWKARRAIVKCKDTGMPKSQQRVFAVQVFELHRLIKVQQLIAGSPDLMLEESTFLSKPSLKASTAEKLPSHFVKPLPHFAKRKDDSQKPNHKIECSAENAVGKTLSSVKNGSQLSNYGLYLANQPPAQVDADPRMGPWCSHQSPGQQWLIPVRSPSEGLIYKPYPGPGFMGTVCGGGWAPPNIMHPGYGIPSIGAHLAGHSYFRPYGMPVMNLSISDSAEQKNQFNGPGSHGQFSQGRANFNMLHESSCNVSARKSGAVPPVRQFQASKDTELLENTASCPGERVQGDGVGHAAEGRDAFQIFTVSPVALEAAPQPHDADQPTKAIKVVPHNPRSATASVARIIQSIQEERKQYDSI